MQAPEALSAQKTSPDAGRAAPEADGRARKHFKTEGENRFNWQTYIGLGYFANVAISLGAVYWAERTHMGHKLIGSIARGLEKLGAPAEKTAFLARKSFFLAGGFAVIPFMKGLEDHKSELVKKYNRQYYGAQAETDPTIVESEREVEQAPKQGWASILSGRALALLPFYATIGLLWNQTSKLSLATNPEFAKLGKVGREALKQKDPLGYAELAAKGHYFDRRISDLSRDLGKLAASRGTYFDGGRPGAAGLTKFYHSVLSLLGKPLRLFPAAPDAVAEIEAMGKAFPGALQSVTGEQKKELVNGAMKWTEKKLPHDPIHAALPYYAISEAITSAMVAWGLFVITRVTGPFFDKKHREPDREKTAPIPAATEAFTPRAERHSERPATRVATDAAALERLHANASLSAAVTH